MLAHGSSYAHGGLDAERRGRQCVGVEGKHGLQPVVSNHPEAKSRHVMLDVLSNDGVAVERKPAVLKLVEESGQRDLRDVDQYVDVLREPRPTSEDGRQPAEHRVSDAPRIEHLDGRDGRDEVSSEWLRCFRHVASRSG
jgi:hypothetical protein